jgi:hypothetical protein
MGAVLGHKRRQMEKLRATLERTRTCLTQKEVGRRGDGPVVLARGRAAWCLMDVCVAAVQPTPRYNPARWCGVGGPLSPVLLRVQFEVVKKLYVHLGIDTPLGVQVGPGNSVLVLGVPNLFRFACVAQSPALHPTLAHPAPTPQTCCASQFACRDFVAWMKEDSRNGSYSQSVFACLMYVAHARTT